MKTHALAERFRIMAKRYGLNLKTTTVGQGGSPVIRRPATQGVGRVKKEESDGERPEAVERKEGLERAPRRGAGKRKYAEEDEEGGEGDEEEGLQEMRGKGMQGSERNLKARAGRKTVEDTHGSDADVWSEDGGRAMTDSDLEGSE